MIKIVMKDSVKAQTAIIEKGQSVRQFAKEVGLSHSYLSQIFSGKRNPSPKAANKIITGLNLSFDSIFFVDIVANDNPKTKGGK